MLRLISIDILCLEALDCHRYERLWKCLSSIYMPLPSIAYANKLSPNAHWTMHDATVYALDCVFVEWVNGERYGCDNKDRRYLLSVYGNIFDVSDRPKPRILLLMRLLWCGKLYDPNSSCMMCHHDVHLQSRSWQVWPQWSVCKSDGKGQQSVVFLSCKEQVASWNVDVLCRSGRAVVQGSHLGIVCWCWHCGVYKQAADSARFHC